MRTLKLATSLLLGKLAATAAEGPYSCGDVSEQLNIIEDPVGRIRVEKSEANKLCILFRVTAIGNALLEDFDKDSGLADYNIAPVSRSYDGKDWQRVAGPYSQSLTVDCPSSSSVCEILIPGLSDLEAGRLVFMPFEHSLTNLEKVSRFFHQTTFGPTKRMLDSWDLNSELNSEMASWVQDQMNESTTAMTSHRRYFRERLNGELNAGIENPAIFGSNRGQILKVRNPCASGARWMSYSFTVNDSRNVIVDVTQESDSLWYIRQTLPNSSVILRTIMTEWVDFQTGEDLGAGAFEIGFVEETLGGYFRVRRQGSNTGQRYVRGGNPPFNVPTSASLYRFLSNPITESNLEAGLVIETGNGRRIDGNFIVRENFTDSLCTNFDVSNSLFIVGTSSSGVQLRYGRYIEVEDNTIEDPLLNGSGVDRCSNPIMDMFNSDHCALTFNDSACSSVIDRADENLPAGSAVVVCGSDQEVANNPSGSSIFQFKESTDIKGNADFASQKKSVWTMIAMSSADQLRQKVAWALSQILVITPNQIQNVESAENYLNYYDIFVKHAFGNYFDILKEVSFSAMMGEMLGYIESVSRPYVYRNLGILQFPDENFAREVMQLFSIGVYELNLDGSKKLDENGSPILTYDAEDIQNFARAWTGFFLSPPRSNIEGQYSDLNQVDPMRINGLWRDPSPKTNLRNGYIGDGYPLCSDLPAKHFLKKGAKYVLVGSSRVPLYHSQPSWWVRRGLNIDTLELNTSSDLFNHLCQDGVGNCNFAPVVTLDSDLSCSDGDPECDVDTLRLIKVQRNPDVHYEYVRQACVEKTFFENSVTIQARSPRTALCANANLTLAMAACCENPQNQFPRVQLQCRYTAEKTTLATSAARCSNIAGGSQCQSVYINNNVNEACQLNYDDNYYWQSESSCTLQAKVLETGAVAIVHNPTFIDPDRSVDINVDVHNPNYFKVLWTDGYPSNESECTSSGCSYMSSTSECLCNVLIEDTAVFTSLPSISLIESSLTIGGIDVSMSEQYSELEASSNRDVIAYSRSGQYDKDTIFLVSQNNKTSYYKNELSMVTLGTSNYSFRNPVQFLNYAAREARDALDETDAVLNHYFHHENVAPFLALRMIQRFGTSNPSPNYIEAVATAFKNGTYTSSTGETFGDGKYGSLASMVAAIILHDEARYELLDADPTHGSLREPLLKVIAFMRAMEFTSNIDAPELRLNALQARIGQHAHSIPNVFSFFLPEHSASGHIKAASLTSPEDMVMNGPSLTALNNGIWSLTELGLMLCYGGFGDGRFGENCQRYLPGGNRDPDDYNRGKLTVSLDTSSATSVVDELNLLLTAGRLNESTKSILLNAYTSSNDVPLLQKLVTSTPEFHASGLVKLQATQRPEIPDPIPSTEPYKAIVILNLSGGADSYNMLVPKCTSLYNQYASVRNFVALPQASLLDIDASGSSQPCSEFGLHPNLSILQSMYNDEDLLFLSNIGVLQEAGVNKENWRDKSTMTALFAHNTQQSEIQLMDIFNEQAGRGMAGRLLDVLSGKGFKVNSISTARSASQTLVGNEAPIITVPSASSYEKFDPISAEGSDPNELIDLVKMLNNATSIGSSLLSEAFSTKLHFGLAENQLLYDILQAVTIDTTFPDTRLGEQLSTVAKMIKTKDDRGVDRDVFFVQQDGFDTHDNLGEYFDGLTTELNDAISAFKDELGPGPNKQDVWDDITVVSISEFARTLSSNSGNGTDHAWAGNHFVFGGAIQGAKILGEYPSDLSITGPNSINERGVLFPTTPFEALWNAVIQWFGVTDNADLNEVLPNRMKFTESLFGTDVFYGYSTTSSPTISNAPSPSGTVSSQPSNSPSDPIGNVIDFSWYIPGSRFADQNINVGDTIRFVWTSPGSHDVYFTENGECNGNLIDIGGDISGQTSFTYRFLQEGSFTFLCSKGQGSHCNAGQIVTFNVVSSTLSPSPSSTPSRLRSSSPSESPSSQPSALSLDPSSTPSRLRSSQPSIDSENTLSPSTNPGSCNNDPLYKFEIKPGKFRKCKFISKNLAKLSTRRAKFCYESDGVTVSSTGVACILACGLCDPSSYPSLSPSLSLVPTTECSIPGQKPFQVEVNLDSSIKENVIVVKKQVCVLSQCRFSKKVFRRNKKKFDTPNGTYNWRKCLNPNNCYRFQIFDYGANNVGNGFTNTSGDYTVAWDGNTVKSSNFNTPGNLKKETVKFGNCASSSQQTSTRKEHTTENIFE